MDKLNVAKHVAIILDGNGRWAKKRLKPRTYGHKVGAENVIDICLYAKEKGVECLTLYAFSTENWKRPKEEVSYLMNLLISFIKTKFDILMKEDCKLNILGDTDALPDKVREVCLKACEDSKDNKSLLLNVALNYGGRAELVHAFKNMLRDGIKEDEVDEELISSYLYSKGQSDPDLLIRPGGELRISNFLIYQMAYTEFYFTDTLWPDFTREDFDKALEAYNNRNRRFGGLE
ncbi:isoprenyl transferase [Anaerococcus sp. AGMB09787]|uniref:isoprenyl transferase n=1 Tax=Anaerococcus sp. AGMB09787 TaxID=2922869 RepID=UPI001FB01F92|nr:isoprenyl transferase [Anaerococcus sp. AGMB09787]